MTSHLIDDASQVIPSTPVLVNLVSKRVRQLLSGHRPLVETSAFTSVGDIALMEIIEGKITPDIGSAVE